MSPLLGGSNGFIKTPCFLGRVRKVEVPVQWAGTRFCLPPFSQVNRYIGYEDDIKIMHGSLKEIQNPWKNQTYWIHINYQIKTSKNPPLQPFCKHNYSPFPEKNSLDSRMTIIFFPRDTKYFPRRTLSVQIVSKYVFIVPKKTPVFSNAEFVVAKNDIELSDLTFIKRAPRSNARKIECCRCHGQITRKIFHVIRWLDEIV